MNRKVIFVSFGDSINYSTYLNRISKEATRFSVIDTVQVFTEKDLGEDFLKSHGKFMSSNKLGYGYFIWKPQVISEALNLLNENDILIYADAGCHLNIMGQSRLNEYIQLLKKSSMICFELEHENHLYTKRKCFDIIDTDNNYFNSKMIAATALIIKKTKSSCKLLEQWKYYSCMYDLIDESDGKRNHSTFQIHRYDQSILSLIARNFNDICILPDETWFQNFYKNGKKYPILAVRRCGKIPKFLKFPYPLNYFLSKLYHPINKFFYGNS